MKLVTLMENTTACDNLRCEHGLSLYLETGNHKILFDAGQSSAFAENAEKLGVDLREVDFAVLSHGHYDHGGGLEEFLKINNTAPVYISSHAFEPHYSANGYIGLDLQLQGKEQLRSVAEETALAEGITLYQLEVVPADTAGLEMEEQGQRKPDDFRHEQYLLVEEGGKRILISGCSHKGILQIMEAFRPDILVGGFHFMKITEEAKLAEAAKKLLEYDTVYYTGHCTGLTQYAYLKSVMGDQLHYIATGTIVEL
jgi:7,8-dihydropterin-6-yl-methyl-4-(beta-D-ribofuranosyl)aminobenzene 5'-phosphate synthase